MVIIIIIIIYVCIRYVPWSSVSLHRLYSEVQACCDQSLLLPENFTKFTVSGCDDRNCQGIECDLDEQHILQGWWHDPDHQTPTQNAYPDQHEHHTLTVRELVSLQESIYVCYAYISIPL